MDNLMCQHQIDSSIKRTLAALECFSIQSDLLLLLIQINKSAIILSHFKFSKNGIIMALEASLRNKRVLITGAGSGIGRALAVRLHSYGSKILALDKDPTSLASLKSDLPGAETLQVDLTDWNGTRAAVEAIGPLDSLVNNAAILIGDGFFNIQPQDFDKTMEVNVKAVINVSQVVAKSMIDNGTKGTIVNISSVAALRAFPNATVHSMSKAALDMLTKIMAAELGPKGIRVNSVLLGSVVTNMLTTWLADLSTHYGQSLEAVQAAFIQRVPLQKPVLDMEDAVNTILFAMSDLSAMTTGTDFVVDGGFCTT